MKYPHMGVLKVESHEPWPGRTLYFNAIINITSLNLSEHIFLLYHVSALKETFVRISGYKKAIIFIPTRVGLQLWLINTRT